MGQNTPDMARIERIREMGRTMTQPQIGAALGISAQRVSLIALKHGIKTAGQQARTAKTAAARQRFVVECQGMTAKEAAEHMGVSTVSIYEYAKATGLELARPIRPKNAITLKVLAEAPAMAEAGFTKSQVARRLGMSSGALTLALGRYLPDLKWRDGRQRSQFRPRGWPSFTGEPA